MRRTALNDLEDCLVGKLYRANGWLSGPGTFSGAILIADIRKPEGLSDSPIIIYDATANRTSSLDACLLTCLIPISPKDLTSEEAHNLLSYKNANKSQPDTKYNLVSPV